MFIGFRVYRVKGLGFEGFRGIPHQRNIVGILRPYEFHI